MIYVEAYKLLGGYIMQKEYVVPMVDVLFLEGDVFLDLSAENANDGVQEGVSGGFPDFE